MNHGPYGDFDVGRASARLVGRLEASILREVAEPDAKIADVARRRDIRPQQIYTWGMFGDNRSSSNWKATTW